MLRVENAHVEQKWWQKRQVLWTIVCSAILGVAGGAFWWFLIHPFVSTDDARVAATLVRIAPEGVGGKVIRINAVEGDRVKKGDVLIELDHKTTEAQLQRARAKAHLAERELRRISELVANKGLPARDLDQAKANFDTADAETRLAEIALERTTLTSPIDGIVVQKTTEEGNIVEPGQALLTVADAEHAWIAANIEETSVGQVRVGQPVDIAIDEGGRLYGKVSEVNASVASQFALIPSDSGAGNFTKVVQRVPIKIQVTSQTKRVLRAGQSAEIKIHVH